jgi:hypothetical protein
VVARTIERMMAVTGARWGLKFARATTVAATLDINMAGGPGLAWTWSSGAIRSAESAEPDGRGTIFGLAPDGVLEQPIRLSGRVDDPGADHGVDIAIHRSRSVRSGRRPRCPTSDAVMRSGIVGLRRRSPQDCR